MLSARAVYSGAARRAATRAATSVGSNCHAGGSAPSPRQMVRYRCYASHTVMSL